MSSPVVFKPETFLQMLLKSRLLKKQVCRHNNADIFTSYRLLSVGTVSFPSQSPSAKIPALIYLL